MDKNLKNPKYALAEIARLTLAVTSLQEENQRLNEEVAELKSHASDPYFLTSQEAADYLGISLSTLYKMTHKSKIPYYKPSGKTIYFRRADINLWIGQGRRMSAN